MTAEKVRSAQSQLENLKSLKSVVMGNANAFAKELSTQDKSWTRFPKLLRINRKFSMRKFNGKKR